MRKVSYLSANLILPVPGFLINHQGADLGSISWSLSALTAHESIVQDANPGKENNRTGNLLNFLYPGVLYEKMVCDPCTYSHFFRVFRRMFIFPANSDGPDPDIHPGGDDRAGEPDGYPSSVGHGTPAD